VTRGGGEKRSYGLSVERNKGRYARLHDTACSLRCGVG
jgi:hypothetical protein